MKKLSLQDKIIHDQFSEYGRNSKEWMNKCILLLPKVEKNRIWAKKRFSSIYEYAAKIAGMSRNKVNKSLRILKKTENLPALRKVIEKKGIFAVKPVVNIATIATDGLWAKKASEMKKSTLETFVRDYIKEQEVDRLNNLQIEHAHANVAGIDNGATGRLGAGHPTHKGLNKPNISQENLKTPEFKINISMKLEPEILQALKEVKGEDDWNFIMKKMLKSYRKELEVENKQRETEEKQFQEELKREKPEAVKTYSRTISTTISNYVKKRAKGLCEHPNCKKPGKHIHHTEPFALKMVHDPDKLVYLCEEHHQIIHLGYIDDGSNTQIHQSMPISSVKPMISWQQIERLPSYDIKNIINQRIADAKVKPRCDVDWGNRPP